MPGVNLTPGWLELGDTSTCGNQGVRISDAAATACQGRLLSGHIWCRPGITLLPPSAFVVWRHWVHCRLTQGARQTALPCVLVLSTPLGSSCALTVAPMLTHPDIVGQPAGRRTLDAAAVTRHRRRQLKHCCRHPQHSSGTTQRQLGDALKSSSGKASARLC